MKITAIILAAGKGSRMQSSVKKQYMNLCGRPVIWYTLRAFHQSSVDEIILVTGQGEEALCQKLIEKSGFNKVKHIIKGGKERYESVYAGLSAADGSSYVLIHDGARPLISVSLIEKCIHSVKKNQACIAAVPVKDTIKIVSGNGKVSATPERKYLWSVQTPQAFSYELIKRAYSVMFEKGAAKVTDDAMVVEQYTDKEVEVIEGEYTNIKITTPEDLILAERMLESVDTEK